MNLNDSSFNGQRRAVNGARSSALIRTFKAHLEMERLFGIDALPKGNPRESKAKRLAALLEEVKKCRACGLCLTKTNLVFGTGKPNADLVFVGEAPGYKEDLQGLPFVGRAGALLTKIIEAIGLTRDEVYIGNILKCRPPENRTPRADEIAACYPHLVKQLSIIRPKIICALGAVAAQTLLQTKEGINKLRGRFHPYPPGGGQQTADRRRPIRAARIVRQTADGRRQTILVMPTYHPAYLLRNPAAKRPAWEDMKKVRDALKETPPSEV